MIFSFYSGGIVPGCRLQVAGYLQLFIVYCLLDTWFVPLFILFHFFVLIHLYTSQFHLSSNFYIRYSSLDIGYFPIFLPLAEANGKG
jgi:hypothetical protein